MKEDKIGYFTAIGDKKYQRDWVLEILSMSSKQRRAFLAGFLIADGHYDVGSGIWKFSQLRNEHYEAALTASFIEHDGFVSVHSNIQDNGNEKMVVSLRKKQHTTMQCIKRTVLPEQKLWCMATENESWVMRQDDVITITGNCLMYGGQPPKLASTLGISVREGRIKFNDFW